MVFERVLVGYDGSAGAEQALALARRLRTREGTLLALTVAETHYAMHAGMDAVTWDKTLRSDAERARAAAEAELHGVPRARTKLVAGHAAHSLLAVAESMDADLVSVGAHCTSRLSGILRHSVATSIIHDARCSVLAARGSKPAGDFPRSIVVGLDTSEASIEAVAVAEALAASTRADVRYVAATGGKRLPALIDVSRSADLLVVGSRGLHGFPALGSVAERVAHEAVCPVVIVRGGFAAAGAAAGRLRAAASM